MDLASFIKQYGIGLTGGIATGKSTVAKIIQAEEYSVFDADILARQAVEVGSPTLAALVGLCGKHILGKDAQLDRQMLGSLIFADKDLRLQVVPLIQQRIWELLEERIRLLGEATKPRHWFFDAALLCESGSYKRFAQIWLTVCPESVQRQRLIARDHFNPAYAKQVIASQFSNEHKKKLADVIIDTAQPAALVRQLVLKHLGSLLPGLVA